jgi:hypothetical protein
LEIEELFARNFFEDSPGLCIFVQVIQSELKRSSGYDTLSKIRSNWTSVQHL